MKLHLLLLLILFMTEPLDAGVTRIIPFVLPESTVTIVNDEPNTQQLQVTFTSIVMNFRLLPMEHRQIRSPERGFVLIRSEKTDFLAWSVVQGAVFQAVLLNTFSHGFIADRHTGIVISNPWDTAVNVTLEFFREDGSHYRYNLFVVEPGSAVARFLREMVPIGDAACYSNCRCRLEFR